MNFDLTSPCSNCPFLKKGGIRLRAGRIRNLADDMLKRDRTFTCHKTTVSVEDDDGGSEREDGPNAQHCVGALLFCEAHGRVPQFVRIAERLGAYEPSKLKGHKLVFRSLDEMLQAAVDPPPKGTGEPCSIVDEGCTAPAGYMRYGGAEENDGANAEYECSNCGQPVCGACSRDVKVKKSKRSVRLCNECAEES